MSEAVQSAAADANAATPFTPPSPKQNFLDRFTAEHATTMKVLRAFPAEQSEFRPHPRSQSARELAFTFVIEQQMMMAAVTDQLDFSKGFPSVPDDFNAIVEQFDREFAQTVELIQNTPDERLYTTTKFFSGPGKMADFPKIDLVWFLLCDQIHHRGQYSVYLRMAGGKVPSIYGPSADEPWM